MIYHKITLLAKKKNKYYWTIQDKYQNTKIWNGVNAYYIRKPPSNSKYFYFYPINLNL